MRYLVKDPHNHFPFGRGGSQESPVFWGRPRLATPSVDGPWLRACPSVFWHGKNDRGCWNTLGRSLLEYVLSLSLSLSPSLPLYIKQRRVLCEKLVSPHVAPRVFHSSIASCRRNGPAVSPNSSPSRIEMGLVAIEAMVPKLCMSLGVDSLSIPSNHRYFLKKTAVFPGFPEVF